MAICVADSQNAAYDGNISTANGFYRAEAGTLACLQGGVSISTIQNQALTFANAGNCLGIVLILTPNSATTSTIDRSVTVELQELVGGTTWTTRATKTLTALEICVTPTANASTGYDANEAGMITAFKFASPYAVTTTAGIWRVTAVQVGGTVGTWTVSLATAAGTWAVIAYCDTQISFTSNQDQFVAIDPIILDQATVLLGGIQAVEVAPIVPYCGWICSGVDRTPDNVCNLKWADAPATSYTVEVRGFIIVGAAGGFRAGTSTNPIPIAQAGTLDFRITNTAVDMYSPRNYTGFISAGRRYTATYGLSSDNGNKGQNFFIYGEVPTYEHTTLAADALGAQNVIVTTDTTGWVAGDELVVSKKEAKGSIAIDSYLISSVNVDGVTITLTQNLDYKRLAGGRVTRLNGYGFRLRSMNRCGTLTSPSTTQFDITNPSGTTFRYTWDGTGTSPSWSIYTNTKHSYVNFQAQNFNAANNGMFRLIGTGSNYVEVTNPAGVAENNKTIGTGYIETQQYGVKLGVGAMNNFVLIGCMIDNVGFEAMNSVGTLNFKQKHGLDLPWTVTNCSVIGRNNLQCQLIPPHVAATNLCPPINGMEISYCHTFRSQFFQSQYVANGQGSLYVHHNFSAQSEVLAAFTLGFNGQWRCEDNIFMDGQGSNSYVVLNGTPGCLFKRNEFWGANTGQNIGCVRLQTCIGITGFEGNKFDNNQTSYYIGGGTLMSAYNKSYGDEFGQEVANTYDIVMLYRSFHIFEMEMCVGNPVISFYGSDLTSSLYGSSLAIVSENQVVGADRIYKQEGILYKAGTGLTDTTKHNETYSLKFVPYPPSAFGYSSQDPGPLSWTQKIPTENIQNKDMMVGIWIKIDNAAYWGSTNEMPRITVNYDNGTTAYGEAAQSNDWQFVFCPFTPLTTYGEITVTISGKSYAGAANSIWYAAEMSVLYPAGHNIEMGKFNTWSSALPTMPSISTTISAADVWAVDPTLFGASTVGDKVNAIKRDTALIPGGL